MSGMGNSGEMGGGSKGRRSAAQVRIDVHADDYGLSAHTSRDILGCLRAGRLDSISIVPNTESLAACMELLQKEAPSLPFFPRWSVHLNLVEGRCLSGRDRVPDLADEKGCMKLSWGELWKANYLPGRRSRLRAQLKTEIRAQIDALWKEPAFAWLREQPGPDGRAQNALRIDGHQHVQMIPVVREALCQVLREGSYPVEYIRLSAEPAAPYLMEPALYPTYRPVNWVKNLLLNVYGPGAGKAFRRVLTRAAALEEPESMYLWGLVMSGRMDPGRVERLYPHMLRQAARKGKCLEILFHPGRMEREEAGELSPASLPFYLSADRTLELEAVLKAGCLTHGREQRPEVQTGRAGDSGR